MSTLTIAYTAALTDQQIEFWEHDGPSTINVYSVDSHGYVFEVVHDNQMRGTPFVCKAESNVLFDTVEQALEYAFGDPEIYVGAEWSDEI
jgi:hypothetical protein